MTTGICGVILAAGESSRMGRDKALLPWPKKSEGESQSAAVQSGGTLLSAAIHSLSPWCDLVLVVAGKNANAIQSIVYSQSAFLTCNHEPERGQFSSLQIGLQEVLDHGRDAAMITLVDRPPVRSETLGRLVQSFSRRDHGTWAVVPEFDGKHGHPILVGREMIEAFLKAPVTSSAREIEHANQNRISYIPVPDPSVVANIDTPEDYLSLQCPP